jgi:hypothetical protein
MRWPCRRACPHLREANVEAGCASSWPGAGEHEHHDPIAGFDESFRLAGQLVERLAQILDEPPDLRDAAVGPGKTMPARRLQLDVGVHESREGVRVAAAARRVNGLERLDIGTRHDAASIALGWS